MGPASPGWGPQLRSRLHPAPLHAQRPGVTGWKRGAAAGLPRSLFAPGRAGEDGSSQGTGRAALFGERGEGSDGVGEGRGASQRGPGAGKAEEQPLSRGFASRGAGWPALWVPGRESWVHRGAVRPSPAGPRPRQEQPWERRVTRTSSLSRMGGKGQFIQERGARLCGDPPKPGKLSQAQHGCLGSGCAPFAGSGAPAPSPAHCSGGSGRCLPSRTAVVGEGGGRGGEILTWLPPGRNLGEPRPRAQAVL